MDQDVVISLATQAMGLALKISLPLLGVGLIVGVLISIIQAVTSIQEQTLAFIPKVVAMAVVLVVGGPWMLNQLLSYTAELWTSDPQHGGVVAPQLQNSAAQLLTDFGEQRVLAFFLVLARLSPLFVLAPLFSSKMVPARVRAIVAVSLAIGLSPVVSAGMHLPTDIMGIGSLLAKELLVGSAFAYALAATFAALAVAGSFLDTTIGFSYGGLVDPINGNQSAVLSTAYSMIGLMVFIAIGGDAWVIKGLARTYDVVDLVQYPSLGHIVNGADGAFIQVFTSAIEVAGPGPAGPDPHRRRVRHGHARRPAAQRLPGRHPGQGRRRPAARRRLDALRRRLDRRSAAGRRRRRPQHAAGRVIADVEFRQDREGNTQASRRRAQEGPGRQVDRPQRRGRGARRPPRRSASPAPRWSQRMADGIHDALTAGAQRDPVTINTIGDLMMQAGKNAAICLAPIAGACALAGDRRQPRPGRHPPEVPGAQAQLPPAEPEVGLSRRSSASRASSSWPRTSSRSASWRWVVLSALLPHIQDYASMVGISPLQFGGAVSALVKHIALRATFAYLLIGVVDFVYQRYSHEKSLRMKKEEVKEEGKGQDLPAEVKSAIRRRQREQARARMMADVPTADVIVTNPTHYSVALQVRRPLRRPDGRRQGQGPDRPAHPRDRRRARRPDRPRPAAGARAARLRRGRPADPRGAVRRRGADPGLRLPRRRPPPARPA